MAYDITKLAKRPSDDNGSFIGKMFHCRDLVHLAHLKTKSYAEHKALNELYDGLLGKIDDIAETLQGYKGILNIVIPEVKYQEILPYLKSEREEYIKKLSSFASMPDIQNMVQEVIGMFSSTIYKLENLK